MDTLEFLVCIRHCDCSGQNLSDKGIEQARQLARTIAAKVTKPRNILLMSSPVPRAHQTAEIIAAELSVSVVDVVALGCDRWGDRNREEALEDVWKELSNHYPSHLIIVGHGGFISNLAQWILDKIHNISVPEYERSLKMGECHEIDIPNRRYQFHIRST